MKKCKTLLLFLALSGCIPAQDEPKLINRHPKPVVMKEAAQMSLAYWQADVRTCGVSNSYSPDNTLLIDYKDPSSGKEIFRPASFSGKERFAGYELGIGFMKGEHLIINAFHFMRGYNWGMKYFGASSGIAYLYKPSEESNLSLRPGINLLLCNIDDAIFTQRDSLPGGIKIHGKTFNKLSGTTFEKNSVLLQTCFTATYDLGKYFQLFGTCTYNFTCLTSERIKFTGENASSKKEDYAYLKASGIVYDNYNRRLGGRIMNLNGLSFKVGIAALIRS